jgi:hypothetical protein
VRDFNSLAAGTAPDTLVHHSAFPPNSCRGTS